MIIGLTLMGRATIAALELNRKGVVNQQRVADSLISSDKLSGQALIPLFAGASGAGIAQTLLKFSDSRNFLVNTSLPLPFPWL